MSSSVASEVETPVPPRGGGIEKIAAFAVKLVVTAACFWYVSRQIDFAQLKSAIPQLDFRWAAFGVVIAVAETPLVGLRWRNILDALGALNQRMTHAAVMAVAAIGIFFVQVLPSVAGGGVRALLLVRLRRGGRQAPRTAPVRPRARGLPLVAGRAAP